MFKISPISNKKSKTDDWHFYQYNEQVRNDNKNKIPEMLLFIGGNCKVRL